MLWLTSHHAQLVRTKIPTEAKKDLNKKKQENLIIRKITKKADIAITHKEIRESMNIQNESDEEQFHNY